MTSGPSAVIVADGGIDLPEGYAQRYGIQTIPLMLSFGQEELRSGIDITAEQFYKRLRVDPAHPTTSQPSVGDYAALYRKAGEAGLPILSFHLSAGLSGSVGAARLAREMVPELAITQVDTGTLSGAMGMQVLVAAEMALRGEPVERIVEQVKAIGRDSDIYFTVDTLEYLRRGGRIGRVAGAVGSLLGIRPVVTVDKATGTYVACGRARSFRAAAAHIIDLIAGETGDGADVSCIVLQGDCPEETERFVERLQARLGVRWLHVMRANPALGVHIGPDTIGLAVYRGILPIGDAGLPAVGD